MAIGSGLGAQFGYKSESVYGTAVVVDQFNDFDSESMRLEQRYTDPQGLAAGRLVPLASRRSQTSRNAAGSVTMDFAAKSMSRLIRQCLGSPLSAPTLITGSAYRHNHTYGNAGGMSMTWQFGRPQPDGTSKPFTYTGVKVVGWEISSRTGEQVKLNMDADAKDETTASGLATASYTTTELFNHNQLVVKLGGTASTTSGVVSIAGGTTMTTLANGVTVRATNPMATDRYGSSQTKSEPIQNGMLDASIEFDAEFTSQTEIYDVFRADTTVPVQLTWTGSLIGGTNYYQLDIIASACKYDPVQVNVDGPDVVNQTIPLRIFADTTNNPLQVALITTDSTF